MSRPSAHSYCLRVLCAVSALLLSFSEGSAGRPDALGRLQALVDNLRGQLAIDHAVSPAIVASNALLVSVEPIEEGSDTPRFRMAFDARFLAGLDEEALTTIVAHELGHVWIFTHHPYLQTERLANRVAMRVVSRDSLERVYVSMWQRQGLKGDLVEFLGQSQ